MHTACSRQSLGLPRQHAWPLDRPLVRQRGALLRQQRRRPGRDFRVLATAQPATIERPAPNDASAATQPTDAAGKASTATPTDKPATTLPSGSPPLAAGASAAKPGADQSRVKAVAAKISAARELARRLAEEQQAVMAARQADDKERLVKPTEDATAAAAVQAARADMLARRERQRVWPDPDVAERLRRENSALRQLLVELAVDREEAHRRMAETLAKIAALPSTALAPEATSAPAAVSAPAAEAEPAAKAAAAATATATAEPAAAPKAAADAAVGEQRTEAAAAVEVPPPPPAAAAAAAAPPADAPAPAAAPAVVEAAPRVPAAPAAPTAEQLRELAAAAVAAGDAVFYWPVGGVPVGSKVQVYYNRVAGPLPAMAVPQIKAGLNKWEDMAFVDMQRAEGLASDVAAGEEWWEGRLALPRELFRVDFVVQDVKTGAVDNNRARDFSLPITGGPSEQELLEARAAAFEVAEAARLAMLEGEEARLWEGVVQEGEAAAEAARQQYRERREKELREAAAAVIAERRRPRTTDIADAVPDTYAWLGAPKAGSRAQLLYNCRRGPLSFTDNIKVHVGYDGWYKKERQTTVMEEAPAAALEQLNPEPKGGAWVAAWVDVPSGAATLDFVFSDREERNWDNNSGKDFHTAVVSTATDDSMAEMVFQAMKREAAEVDAVAQARMGESARKRVEAKAMVMRRRRAAQQEFLYTLPLTPKAGEECTVYYSPDLTNLRGRPQVFMRAGFNRWRHATQLGPLKMEPSMPGGIGFQKVVIQVPEDAQVIDLVFSDSATDPAGFYDNNGGLDYHIGTTGSTGTMPKLRIAHIAVEMAPIAKVGGMGDVVTALSRAVLDEGHEVEVVVPKYDIINYGLVQDLHQEGSFFWGGTNVRVWKGKVEGLPTTFLEPENGHFWRGCIYGRNDDAARFEFFCGAALEYLKVYNVQPDIVHAHDWQSASVMWGQRWPSRGVFTIHNLNYGVDRVSGAMAACDVATTVSPTYAREVSGHQSVAPHLSKMYGIRNGIDQDLWDPATDEFIPRPYGPTDVVAGKAAAKQELRRRTNMANVDVPLVGCVTRLVHQKGIHLIKHAAWRTLERGGQFVLLGSAPDPRVQAEFNGLRDQLMRQYPDRAALIFNYDEPLSHLIYAASDMFLVPSIFEPCGLTQMVAMRYGSVPVVRRTGGLADTVFDIDHDQERAAAAGLEPNGFNFEATDTAGMDYALNRALSLWYSDRPFWGTLAGRVMQQDWSWDGPALDYIELYWKALKAL